VNHFGIDGFCLNLISVAFSNPGLFDIQYPSFSFYLNRLIPAGPAIKNQIASDNADCCASGWLGLMLSDQILLSQIISEYINWHQHNLH
jgi:hypothetical protein